MKIRIDKRHRCHLGKLKAALEEKLARSRFKARVVLFDERTLALWCIRLRQVKFYCGNHPGPCMVPHEGAPRRATYLEGADWVAFDDMLNDVLDDRRVSAYVWSAWRRPLVLRRGKRRRTCYFAEWKRDRLEWEQDEESDFEDWTHGRAPRSDFEPGTPGLSGWRKDGRDQIALV